MHGIHPSAQEPLCWWAAERAHSSTYSANGDLKVANPAVVPHSYLSQHLLALLSLSLCCSVCGETQAQSRAALQVVKALTQVCFDIDKRQLTAGKTLVQPPFACMAWKEA